MTDKTTGPIYVDFTRTLQEFRVNHLIEIANIYLNTCSLREIGNIMHDADIDINIHFKNVDHKNEN